MVLLKKKKRNETINIKEEKKKHKLMFLPLSLHFRHRPPRRVPARVVGIIKPTYHHNRFSGEHKEHTGNKKNAKRLKKR